MLVYIYACEASYGGLHGMYDEDVVEVRDIEEANAYGYEMAQGVIESYDCFDEDEDVEQELEWRIYKIKEGISADEVRNELGCWDEDEFVERFCESEVLC